MNKKNSAQTLTKFIVFHLMDEDLIPLSKRPYNFNAHLCTLERHFFPSLLTSGSTKTAASLMWKLHWLQKNKLIDPMLCLSPSVIGLGCISEIQGKASRPHAKLCTTKRNSRLQGVPVGLIPFAWQWILKELFPLLLQRQSH